MKKKLNKSRKKTAYIRKRRLIIVSHLFVLIAAIYIYKGPIANTATKLFYNIARTSGFVVNDIYVTETGKVPSDRCVKKLCLNKGDVIFSKSLSEIFEDLMQNPWIDSLSIHKGLPDKISINVSYKKAIAIFQNKSKFTLTDEQGKEIECIDIKRSKWKLPLITGVKANTKINEILLILKSYPNINSKVKALSYIRERRWDIILSNGITVKLPENDVSKSLDSLEIILRQPNITKHSVNIIDMRVKDKVIFSGSKVINQNDKKNIKV